ncbi:hypothetical protein PNBC_16470 [Paenibacillus crassostreae]|uniref:Uncharacterized protein n=1 Tax=Paenibacillus crassostreae TaxID=1763538 RepID=A0A162RJV1_9BACL|nr:hypothetical protein LPB68_10025 [Paenibacillus crassostreae]OAB72487.1 hypothetical protein PNBC_16470 [Paenibacillus crassostreae]
MSTEITGTQMNLIILISRWNHTSWTELSYNFLFKHILPLDSIPSILFIKLIMNIAGLKTNNEDCSFIICLCVI